MEPPSERESSERATEDGSGGSEASDEETVPRIVEAGAGVDVPFEDAGDEDSTTAEPDSTTAEPDGGATSSGPRGEPPRASDPRADTEESDDRGPAGEDDVPPEIRDLLAADDTPADDVGGSTEDDTPADDVGRPIEDDTAGSDVDEPTDDDGSVPPSVGEEADEETGGTTREATDVERGRGDDVERDSAAAAAYHGPGPAGSPETADARATAPEQPFHSVVEHRPGDPTDLRGPADAGQVSTPGREEVTPATEANPATEAEPVSVRSEMSPSLAERQAFLSLLLALVLGGLLATLGNVLQLTRWETLMILVSAAIVVLLIATFVVFRAMLAAAERDDEPYRTAYTDPIFVLLFVITTTVTALFVGYLSRLFG